MSDAPQPDARFAARWFDGHTAESRDVAVELTGAGLALLRAGGESRLWPFHEVVIVGGHAPGRPVRIERRADPIETLVVDDARFHDALVAARPGGVHLAATGAPIRARLVWGLLGGAGAFLAVLYLWIIPGLSRSVADRVPVAVERRLGEQALAEMAPPRRRVTAEAVTAPAVILHARLAGAAELRPGDSRLVVTRSDVVNAYTVPGGTIVVTTALLRTLDGPDELAAVIAHEVGHVLGHHVMRALLRQSLTSLIEFASGQHSAFDRSLRVAGQLGSLAFSRHDEREADDTGMRLLLRTGIPAEALANALERIQAREPGVPSVGFLSTHPAPRERLEHVRSVARDTRPLAVPRAVDDATWARMRRALGDSL